MKISKSLKKCFNFNKSITINAKNSNDNVNKVLNKITRSFNFSWFCFKGRRNWLEENPSLGDKLLAGLQL